MVLVHERNINMSLMIAKNYKSLSLHLGCHEWALIAQWLGHCVTNLDVVGTNLTYMSHMCPARMLNNSNYGLI